MRVVRFLLVFFGALLLAVAVFFALWIFAIGSSRAHILVSNRSGSSISNVVISGSCQQRTLDVIAPGLEWCTETRYQAGGTIRLSFVSATGSYAASPDHSENLSGSCGIAFDISSNMVVTSEVRK
jgi:hypothetical protein